ncbi:Hypothetical_protein [Hexamita inflata]|uniref:Hypothetical_protein n=1 Tax=Hexamita inflata TaxID=28002 RepID=A0AA86TQV3_9EUKA|nr:Hypothetical protein HINF_LOCUS11012 [Hexamita inflata]
MRMFSRQLSQIEKEKTKGEIIGLCKVIFDEFGVGLNAFTIMKFKARNLDQSLIGNLFWSNIRLLIQLCANIQNLQKVQQYQKLIQRDYLAIQEEPPKIIIEIRYNYRHFNLYVSQK